MGTEIRALGAVFVVAFSVAVLPVSAHAQSIYATVSGFIEDQEGSAVAGANVSFENVRTGWRRTVVSQENGAYQIPLVPVGRYRLRVTKERYAEVVVEGLTAGVNEEVVVNPRLTPLSFGETVKVESSSPLVEVTRSDLRSTLTSEVIESIPVDARDVLNLMFLAPGTLPGRRGGGYDQLVEVGIGSQQGQDTVVAADGGIINDPTIGFAAFGPPLNATEEFEFLTNRYSAEFGGGSGGVVNLVTKSGTNEFQADAFLLLRGDRLDARAPFATEETPLDRHQFGFTIGGPIRKDKAHYFVGYDGSRATQTQTVDTGGTRPGLEGPLDVGHDDDGGLAKLSFEARQRHRLTAQLGYRHIIDTDFPFSATPQTITESSRVDADVTGHVLTLGDAWTVSDLAQNELRVSILRSDADFAPNSLDPFEARPSSLAGAFPSMPQGRTDYRYQLTENFFYFIPRGAGGHLLKAGGEYQVLALGGFFSRFGRGAFFFDTDAPFDPNDPATFPALHIIGSVSDYDQSITQWGVYANDDWMLTRRLTLNLGLRYDIEDRYDGVRNPVPYLSRPRPDRDNWSPRLGLAYKVGENGPTVLRAGYGRYYTRIYAWGLLALVNPQPLLITVNPDYRGFTNPNGSSTSSQTSLAGIEPDLANPFTDQFSVGIDHQFSEAWALSVDYVGNRGRDEILRLESNPLDPNTGLRPRSAFGSVPVAASIGSSTYDALQFYLRSARERPWGSIRVGYTISRTRNDHNYFFDIVQSRDELDDLEGWSLNDARHRVVTDGLFNLPGKLRLGSAIVLSTAQSFDVNTGMDLNSDGVLDRPAGEERNGWRGDRYARVDIRLFRPIAAGHAVIEPTLEVFNLFNTTNIDPDTIVGNQLSPLFGEGGSTLHPLYQRRQVQFGLRAKF